jgi:hypothetical protein
MGAGASVMPPSLWRRASVASWPGEEPPSEASGKLPCSPDEEAPPPHEAIATANEVASRIVEKSRAAIESTSARIPAPYPYR